MVAVEGSNISYPTEGGGGHLVFGWAKKVVEDIEILLSVKFVKFRSVATKEKS